MDALLRALCRYPRADRDQRRALIAMLRPRPDDHRRVFQRCAVNTAGAAWQRLWDDLPLWPVVPAQTELRLAAARTDELAAGARSFPGGYRTIADRLTPGHVWLCWEFLEPGADAGLALDGLVAIDDRWVWFPKPWLFLPYTAHLEHWAE